MLAQSLLGLSEKRSSGRNRSRSPGMGPDGGLRGARRRPHGGHRTGSGWTRITPDRSPPRWRVRQPRWPRPPAIAAAHAPAPTRDRLVRSSTRERPAPGGRRRWRTSKGGGCRTGGTGIRGTEARGTDVVPARPWPDGGGGAASGAPPNWSSVIAVDAPGERGIRCVPWTRTASVAPGGQTPGATQRCLNPGFSERIGNSRRRAQHDGVCPRNGR